MITVAGGDYDHGRSEEGASQRGRVSGTGSGWGDGWRGDLRGTGTPWWLQVVGATDDRVGVNCGRSEVDSVASARPDEVRAWMRRQRAGWGSSWSSPGSGC